MVKNLSLILLFLLSIAIEGNTQIFDCVESSDVAECDVKDLSTSFFNPPPGTTPVPNENFCGGGIFHNAGWFSFVAGGTDVSITVTPIEGTCDTIDNDPDLTGIQVALWAGCPDEGGECIAGDGNCNVDPVSIDLSNLIIGEIYNLTIDGCAGSVCEVDLDVSGGSAFELPPLGGADFEEVAYNIRGGCNNELGDETFCTGQPVLFSVDDAFYDVLAAEFLWTVSGGGDPGSIEWEFGNSSGTGPPFQVGELGGDLGGDGINMTFQDPGIYTVCLDNVVTECDANADGPLCIEVTLIAGGIQEFGEYSVCESDLAQGWDPRENGITDLVGGNPWIGGPIFLDQARDAAGDVLVFEVADDCGCEFTQNITVNVIGSIEPGETDLYIFECMLPYEFFDYTVETIDDVGGFFVFEQGAAQTDWQGNNCDSLVNVNVVPLDIVADVVSGNCGPNGTDFTIEVTAVGPDNMAIDIFTPEFTWIDSVTGAQISMGPTATLNTGTYYVNFMAALEDLNFVDGLSGLDATADCIMQLGPFNLEGGASSTPAINPYQTEYCIDNLDLLTFSIDTVTGTDYTWVVPPSYTTVFQAIDSIAVSIANYVPTDTLFVTTANACGQSDPFPLPISVTNGPSVSVNNQPTTCEGQETTISFDGDATNIMSYAWTINGGTITSGDAMSPTIGATFNQTGTNSFSLTVTDLGGCTASESFDIMVDADLAAPSVNCSGDQTQIIFDWADVPGATGYNVTEVNIPAGATGMMNGLQYIVSGVAPGDMATIIVNSEGSSCVEMASQVTCQASLCDLTGVVNDNFMNMEFCQNDPNNTPVQFNIAIPATYTGSFSGSGITADGLFDPNDPSLIVGDNTLTFAFMDSNGCGDTFTATMTINSEPNINLMASSSTFCLGESISITGFGPGATWDFGSDAMGDENNLTYTTSGTRDINVFVVDPTTSCSAQSMITVNVLDTISAPVVICTPSTDGILFSWPPIAGVTDYNVSVSINGGAPAMSTQSDNEFPQGNLNEGDEATITVTAIADNGCDNKFTIVSCEAQTCATPLVEMTADQQIFCSNETLIQAVDLIITVDGNQPVPGSVSLTGDGVVPSGNGFQFDPTTLAAGMYTVDLVYTNPDDMCETNASIDFTLIDVPTPTVVLDNSTICIDQTVTATFSPDNAMIRQILTPMSSNTNALNPDEFEISYDAPGIYDIGIEYNVVNCPAVSDQVQVTVNDTIQTPNILCVNVDTDFVEFGWQDQTAVTEYEIYIDGAFETTTSSSQFRVDNLTSGDAVQIRVVALDPDCGNRESTMICMAQECIDPVWDDSNLIASPVCYTPGTGGILLDITAESSVMPGIGVLSWLEPEVDINNGFEPGNDSQTYNFTAVFTEGNCVSTFDVSVDVLVQPTAQLALNSQDVICVGSAVTVQSNFVANNGETAVWDFAGGDAMGSDFGPYDVTFDTPGDYQIGLFIDNNNCIGDSEFISITVEPELEAPVITCASDDITQIDVTWDAIDCAGEYAILIDGVETDRTSGTSYSINGLMENQEVEVIVEAISACACESVQSAPSMCSTKPCDPTTFSFSDNTLIDYCLDSNAQPFSVSATPDNLTGSGTGVWSGQPVSDSQSGLIDPSLVPAGDYTITYDYEEGGCTYTASFELTFTEAPQVSLVPSDPTCAGETIGSISATGTGGAGPYMFILDNSITQDNGQFDDVEIGNHTVVITDSNGCVNENQVSILAPLPAAVSISGPVSVIVENDASYALIFDNVNNIEDIIWTANGSVICQGPSCTEVTIPNALADFELNVEVTYDGGCTITNSEAFIVDVKEIQAFYIPNTVTFNSGDVNSEWKVFIKGNETFPRSIKIYDRWGNLMHDNVFSLDMPTSEVLLWDGLSNNREVSSGVYVYMLEILIEERTEVVTGDITIFR